MRDLGIGILYLLIWVIGMAFIAGGFATIYPLGQWIWSWIFSGFDTVRASVDMEFAANRSGLTPRQMAIYGALFGAWWGIWSVGFRRLKGHWPHEA